MTPDIHDLIERLGAGLEGVTPGPWVWRGKDGGLYQEGQDPYAYGEAVLLPTYEYDSGIDTIVSIPDATHIANCSPPNIRALLSHIAALSADLASAKEALGGAEERFEGIRKILITHLNEPERGAFWLAVQGRDAARTTLRSLNKEDGRG